ncbi:uncharacterized protein LOC127803504 isoform X2 [Diospyros lotus]|uniref:uncharacterized protein LOC127803504 isoform X2 n=1 Tax=Diospyros lotus TaxID=55363 RepID=UPI002251FEBD|nr:uncharacterized protein LOC127803504 isoform X2 [Diospyros lotus]
MGKKLDALLGRNSKSVKVKPLADLAIARIKILKNQRHVRCSHARSDVVQLLSLGHQDRALLRVEYVIKEQNMLDVFSMVENYCHLLLDRFVLVRNNRECPEELKEAMSSLIFASSRCGELPEIKEMRGIFASKYGSEFVARAVELRNNCGVNPKMVQKLSTRQESLESRQGLLKQIAAENGIALHFEEDGYPTVEEKDDINNKKRQLQPSEAANVNIPTLGIYSSDFSEEIAWNEKLSESIKARKFRDVAHAAQVAFESAAYAAAAARAAVELSRSESQDKGPDDHDGSSHKHETILVSGRSSKSKLEIDGDECSEDIKPSNKAWGFDKNHSMHSFGSESEGEDVDQNRRNPEKLQWSNKKAGLGKILCSSSSDSDTGNQYDGKVTSNPDQTAATGEKIAFDESDGEITGKNQDTILSIKHHHSHSDTKSNSPINKSRTTTRKKI